MFGQSISGNVDMDGNGYAGMVITDLPSHIRTSKQNEKHTFLNIYHGFILLLLRSNSFRPVTEASCLLHSTADMQAEPAWQLKTSVRCCVSAGVGRAVSRCCINILISSLCVFALQMSLSELSWQTALCCWGEWRDNSFWHGNICEEQSAILSCFRVILMVSLSHACVPVLVSVVVGLSLWLQWMPLSSCPCPST